MTYEVSVWATARGETHKYLVDAPTEDAARQEAKKLDMARFYGTLKAGAKEVVVHQYGEATWL